MPWPSNQKLLSSGPGFTTDVLPNLNRFSGLPVPFLQVRPSSQSEFSLQSQPGQTLRAQAFLSQLTEQGTAGCTQRIRKEEVEDKDQLNPGLAGVPSLSCLIHKRHQQDTKGSRVSRKGW